MNSAWHKEAWAAGIGLAAFALIGLLSGRFASALLLAIIVYLAWHVINAWRLYRWLGEAAPGAAPPAGRGLWEDVFYRLRRVQQRNRRSRQRLTRVLAEFQASTAALPDGAVVLDPAGQIVWCNDAAIALLGLRTPQDMGQRIVNLMRYPAFTEYMRAGRYEHGVEAPSPIHPDIRLLLRVVPYGDNQRLLIARDISELKRLEQMRRDFVANASHELRTPLTVLRGYLDMMEEEAGDAGALEVWRSPLRDMLQQSARMEQIITDMLTLARLESDGLSGRSETIDVPDLLDKAVAQAQAVSKGGHHIRVDVDRSLRLRGRANELYSVFSNLVLNAVQYTPGGSHIEVRWWQEDDTARFAVTDDGPGIPARDIPRLTERFYRVDVSRSRATGGTGLGLAIVKHALERHEAELFIESEPGAGAAFTCLFPSSRARIGVQQVQVRSITTPQSTAETSRHP